MSKGVRGGKGGWGCGEGAVSSELTCMTDKDQCLRPKTFVPVRLPE